MAGGQSKARFANGVVSAVLVVLFLVHGVLGSAMLVFGMTSAFSWMIWAAMALVGVHVVLSVKTSHEQLTDSQRPPSPRKKRHLALKWATGCLLAACAFAHIVLEGAVLARVAIVAVAVALAAHLCVGSKSLLKDLNVDRRFKTAFRIVTCVFAALFVAAVLVGAASAI